MASAVTSSDKPSPRTTKGFNTALSKAKSCEKKGDYIGCLAYYKEAQKYYTTEKLDKKVEKMEDNMVEEEGTPWMYYKPGNLFLLPNGFAIDETIFKRLYHYQREALEWLWKVHCATIGGGILADDMGLGKTIQISSFLGALFRFKHIQYVLVVAPMSIVENWCSEMEKWTREGDVPKVMVYHSKGRSRRERELLVFKQKGGVCITTYEMVRNSLSLFRNVHEGLAWDYVVLDEGHMIKNSKSQRSMAIAQVETKHKLLLSGTPLMNSLRETWALFNWTCNGKLLGSEQYFKTSFEQPIVESQSRTANSIVQMEGEKLIRELTTIISPYFLRREKAKIFGDASKEPKEDEKVEESENEVEGTSIHLPETPRKLTARKNDLTIWLKLSEVQKEYYNMFLSSESVQEALNRTKSPLAAISVLKQICSHPHLLHGSMKTTVDLELPELGTSVDDLIIQSSKMEFVVKLLAQLHAEGRRVLIFSRFVKVLNIMLRVFKAMQWKTMRMDGSVNNAQERQRRIDTFNQDSSYFIFLLTTQVGGVGLNLTSADRVIIFDPAWTSSADNQAVDRAYRISQTKNVVVYRLIMSGTIEEKIYRKQVFKQSLLNCATDNVSNNHRYFTLDELSALFSLDDTEHSLTQRQLYRMHASKRVTDPELDNHLKFLSSTGIIGVSDHDLLFTETDQLPGMAETEEEILAEREMAERTPRKARRSRTSKTPSSRATPHVPSQSASLLDALGVLANEADQPTKLAF